MNTITINELRTKGLGVLNDSEKKIIIRNSRPSAVIMSIEEYEGLMKHLEDLDDIKEIRKRKKNEEFVGIDEL